MAPEFLNTEKDTFKHDQAVSSLSITEDEAVDFGLIQKWINELLQNKGNDMYRMKGVLNVTQADERFVYQGVHMVLNGNFEEPWGKEERRTNKLVFIGKNLPKEQLETSFKACISNATNLERKRNNLRFKVGDEVECMTGNDSWSAGKVVALLYRQEGMSPGEVAPYQIALDDKGLIFAPADVDEVIRRKVYMK